MHPAFDDHLLILPNLTPGKKHSITIKLGAQPTTAPHLTYVSKQMTEAAPTPTGLAFNVKAKSKARFAIAVAEPAIVLNADWQEWDDSNGHIKGFVRSDRRIELVKVSDLRISSDTRKPADPRSERKVRARWHCDLRRQARNRRRLACDLVNSCVGRHWAGRI